MSDLVIRNPDATKSYKLTTLGNWGWTKNAAAMSSPLPEDEGDNNIILKLGGAEVLSNLDFTISDSATDLSDGDNIKTLWDQRNYLEDYFCSGKMDYSAEFYAATNGFTGITGVLYDNVTVGVGNTCLYKNRGQIVTLDINTQGGYVSASVAMKILFGFAP